MDENIKKIFGWKYEKGLKMLEISLVAYLYIIVYKKKKKLYSKPFLCELTV